MNPEFVLVVSDMFVPIRAPDIPEQFKSILSPNKLQHVLSLGNIGSRESYDWLKSLSGDYHCVKGDFDEVDMPEKKVVQIGEWKIGMIHGHQVIPWGDEVALSNVQRELGCDILLWGHTHQIDLKAKEGKFYINPGSISGAFSYNCPDPTPSFVLMILQGEEVIVYSYMLNSKKMKFDVNKFGFSKNSDDFRKIEDEEEQPEEGEENAENAEVKEEENAEVKEEENPEIKEEENKEQV